jgi:dipeptidyl aminopeptidase/acylaminoacyl peptidase
MDETPVIPRKVFFENPDRAAARISPDGRWISYLAPLEGVQNVWVAPVGDPGAARPVTRDTRRGIREYLWAYTSRHVLYPQDEGGNEDWCIHSVDVESEEDRTLTPETGVAARFEKVSPEFPSEILVALNERDEKLHDVHRVNVETGERSLVLENEGFAAFTCDDAYRVRLAHRFRPDGGTEVLQRVGDGWEPFWQIGMEDTLTTWPFTFDRTGERLYAMDSRGRDTGAFTATRMSSGEATVLAEDPRADTSDFLIHPTERRVQAVAFTYDRKRWVVLDETIEPDLEHLRSVADGEMEVLSRTQDDTTWIVAYLMDDGPVRYYLYDRDAKEARFLFTNRESLEGLPLSRMHPVVVEARDGLDLVAYYTLPVWSDRETPGRPDAPLPMVLFVHGGPWARDAWGFNPFHQLYANRGYAVLSVNYRGSTGFGKGFLNASIKQWGRKMHDDLLDAVEWAVEQGIAKRDQVCIMGGSYGGYATLVGLTMTPEVFSCGVDIVGPSNLVTLLSTIPPYWEPQVQIWKDRVGDHTTEEGRALLNERSPLSYVDEIRRPLLIAQGANDPRVKQSESDQIVSSMKEKGIPVSYVLFPDEGHGFARPENSLAFQGVTENFLAEHLGGRSQALAKGDFQGSTIQVPEGAGQVPGLSETLERE